jgi:hypothetical protein
MPKFKIISTAEVELFQYIEAENEEQALDLWDASDSSMDLIDENSVDFVEFDRMEHVE